MNLKNYTSQISSSKSASKIEKYLVEIGATDILKNYQDYELISISFRMPTDLGELPVKLPANVEGVYNLMLEKWEFPTDSQKKRIKGQAQRTAWKTLNEWVVIQTEMILLKQVKFEEVFLPYIWIAKQNKTFFQLTEEKGTLLLEAKK